MAKELLLRRGTTAENKLFVGALGEPSYDTERKEIRIHDGATVGGKVVSAPTGMISSFGGSTAPEGWLVCDGSEISRTDYADLFGVIGTIYGDGDGSITFNLPDISDCFVQGGTPGTIHSAGLPELTGSVDVGMFNNPNGTGVFTGASAGYSWPLRGTYTAGYGGNVPFRASNSNSIYGNSLTVQPKSVEALFCIKY